MSLSNFYNDYSWSSNDFDTLMDMYQKLSDEISGVFNQAKNNTVISKVETFRKISIQQLDVADATYNLSELLENKVAISFIGDIPLVDRIYAWNNTLTVSEKINILEKTGTYVQLIAVRGVPYQLNGTIVSFDLYDENMIRLVHNDTYVHFNNKLFLLRGAATKIAKIFTMENIYVDNNIPQDLLGIFVDIDYTDKLTKTEYNELMKMIVTASLGGPTIKNLKTAIDAITGFTDSEIYDKYVRDKLKQRRWDNLYYNEFDFVIIFPEQYVANMDRLTLMIKYLDMVKPSYSDFHVILQSLYTDLYNIFAKANDAYKLDILHELREDSFLGDISTDNSEFIRSIYSDSYSGASDGASETIADEARYTDLKSRLNRARTFYLRGGTNLDTIIDVKEETDSTIRVDEYLHNINYNEDGAEIYVSSPTDESIISIAASPDNEVDSSTRQDDSIESFSTYNDESGIVISELSDADVTEICIETDDSIRSESVNENIKLDSLDAYLSVVLDESSGSASAVPTLETYNGAVESLESVVITAYAETDNSIRSELVIESLTIETLDAYAKTVLEQSIDNTSVAPVSDSYSGATDSSGLSSMLNIYTEIDGTVKAELITETVASEGSDAYDNIILDENSDRNSTGASDSYDGASDSSGLSSMLNAYTETDESVRTESVIETVATKSSDIYDNIILDESADSTNLSAVSDSYSGASESSGLSMLSIYTEIDGTLRTESVAETITTENSDTYDNIILDESSDSTNLSAASDSYGGATDSSGLSSMLNIYTEIDETVRADVETLQVVSTYSETDSSPKSEESETIIRNLALYSRLNSDIMRLSLSARTAKIQETETAVNY